MPLPGVSETALGAAEMRIEESRRPDRLFDDFLAADFVAAAPPAFPDVPAVADDAALAALIATSIDELAVRTRADAAVIHRGFVQVIPQSVPCVF
jgi:O-methyltransferase involved in polyketide biosynthesis